MFVMEMKAIVHEADKETEGIYDQIWTRDDWKRVFPEAWKEVQFHPDVVRDALGVDANQRLLFGISFGYEDPNASANACRVDRAALEQSVVFHR